MLGFLGFRSRWRWFWLRPIGCSLVLLLVSGRVGLFREARATERGNDSTSTLDLKLSTYLQMVLEHNESVQAQMLEAAVSRHKALAEKGIFEPNLSLSAQREWNERINNSLQQSEQGGLLIFKEHNNIYDSGVDVLAPTGAKVRLGYTLSDLSNNLTNSVNLFNIASSKLTTEYQTFMGVTIEQPLLKNAGQTVTMASIRLAAKDSEIAFQQYRRQLMLAVSQAEAAYWNLYFAQEQLRFFDESIAAAEAIVADTRGRMQAGHASDLEVMEAESGLALRKTKQGDVRQTFYEALGRMRTLYGAVPTEGSPTLRAAEAPPVPSAKFSYYGSVQQSYRLNPEYLIQQQKVDQEELRLGVARNQLLPELNFKGAFGYNGLGLTPSSSWDTLESRDYPSWSAGIELHIPLGGNLKGRHQLSAAQLSLRESVLNLRSLETQIANAVNTAILKAGACADGVQNYQTVIRFNENLLKTQMARLEVGKTEPRKVLEVEADLLDARQSLAEAQVHYQRMLLELQLADGSVLSTRNLDLTRAELKQKIEAALKSGRWPTASFGRLFSPEPPPVH